MEVKRRTARTLVERMSHPRSLTVLEETIAEIRLLTKHDAEIRLVLADAGAVSLLANHLRAVPTSTTPFSLENASAALLNISISAREPLMSTPGLLDALAHSISPAASAEIAQNIATIVFSLLSVDAYRPIIGSKKTLLSALIALIRLQDTDVRTVKDALRALFGVGMYALNRATMVELGAVGALFSLVNDYRPGVVEDTTAVIAKVAGCSESLEAFRNESGIKILVDLVDRETGASRRTRENAVAALLNLVMSGGNAAVAEIREFKEVDVVMKELLENPISVRATSKAEALLNTLERRRPGPVESHWIRDFDLLDISTSSSSLSSNEWTSN